jgi:hypothetical protein
MDTVERELVATTVRDALERVAAEPPAAVDDVLAGLGWTEMLAAEPDAAIDVVFGALGTTHAAATVLDDVVVAALGIEPRADLAVLLPSFGSWAAPATTGAGLMTARVVTARQVLVVSREGAVTMPVDALRTTPARGLDPEAGWHHARVESAPATDSVASGPWEIAVARGRRAVAYQISTTCRAMLALACAHAMERVQFGRPVARFQAVRHRLADALVAIEALEAALGAAADEPNDTTAALAKALAGRAATTVAGHCQQVLAGIGFTTEHPFHGPLKRVMVLDGVFGRADDIVTDLGRDLLRNRSVPMLIEL